MPAEGDQALHHQGKVLLRRLDQQQGAVFCVRTGCRNRAQPDLHAHARGAGAAQGRRHGAGASCGKLYENEYSDSEPVRRHRNAWQGTIHRGDLPALRPVAGYVCQVQDEIPVRAEGIGEKRAATDVENRRKRCPKACGRTWTGRIGVFGRESVYMLTKSDGLIAHTPNKKLINHYSWWRSKEFDIKTVRLVNE